MMINDLRYALRMLRHRPGFVAVSISVLSVAIGATTAVFAFINSVMLQPLPFPAAERLRRVELALTIEGSSFETSVVRRNAFEAWRSSRVVEQIAGVRHSGHDNVFHLSGADRPERVHGALATSSLFATLGAQAQLGRLWARDVGASGVIISDGLWKRRFGGDSTVIGRSISLNATPQIVVGVLGRGFIAGNPQGAVLTATTIDLWLPIDEGTEGPRSYDEVIVRLAPGVRISQAEAELTRLMPANGPTGRVRLERIDAPMRERILPMVRIVVAISLVVLVIACVNLAGLQLSLVPYRKREVAIRVALGGSRSTLFRQLMAEGLLLGAIGGLAGFVLSVWGADLIGALAPTNFGHIGPVEPDLRVFAFGLGITGVAVIASTAVPALQAANTSPMQAMRDGDRTSTGLAGQRFGRWLVACQLALAFVLVAGCALLGRSAAHLARVDSGIRTDNVVVLDIYRPPTRETASAIRSFYAAVRERVEAIPEVTGVTFASSVPFRPRDYYAPEWNLRVVDRDYFGLLGIRVLYGRTFSTTDGPQAQQVAVVSRQLADRVRSNGDAVGSMIDEYLIIGVVDDVRHVSVDQPSTPVLYAFMAQRPDGRMSLLARIERRSAEVAGAIRGAIWNVDPDQPIPGAVALDRLYRESDAVAQRHFVFTVLVSLACCAVALAVIGLYGTLAQFVALRRRDIAIWMALGAGRLQVTAKVLRYASVVIGVGLSAGVVATSFLSRFLGAWLFEIAPLDPLALVSAAMLTGLIGLSAVYLPVRRATQVDPMLVLRGE